MFIKSRYILFLLFFASNSNCMDNNVCSTIKDYYTVKENPNCTYDIAAEANITEIIRNYGYLVEEHKVITPDGYILSMFRIPNYQFDREAITSKGPVILQHGMFNSAASFLGLGNRSLPFTLADAGYDVWLGNFRGTEYSEQHVTFSVYDAQYWNFSLEQIALYDIPTQLNHIIATTGQTGNIVYIGHSLGTSLGFMYGSTFLEDAKHAIKLFIFLAPGGQAFNSKSIVLRTLPLSMPVIMKIVERYGIIRLGSHTAVLRTLFRLLCLESPSIMEGCFHLANWLAIGPKTQVDLSKLPVIFNQIPSGTSLKVVRHLAGVVKYGLSRYDYGLKNIEVYGTPFPPPYDISKIEIPILMMYSMGDWVTTAKDSLVTYSRLSQKARVYGIRQINDFNFNHIDFLYGRNAKSLVYDPIISLLNKLNSVEHAKN